MSCTVHVEGGPLAGLGIRSRGLLGVRCSSRGAECCFQAGLWAPELGGSHVDATMVARDAEGLL